MPKRDWGAAAAYLTLASIIFIIILFITWDISSDLTERVVRDEQRAQSNTEKADNIIHRECRSLDGVNLLECVQEQVEASTESQISKQDLEAQKVMAKFTAIMGYTAIFGTTIGLVSIFLIYATLSETRRMAYDAKESANAAREANEIMKSQKRPWLDVDAVAHGHLVLPKGSCNIGVETKITYTNHGSTPIVRGRTSATLVRFNDGPVDIKELFDWAKERGFPGTFDLIKPIYPNETRASEQYFVTPHGGIEGLFTNGQKFFLTSTRYRAENGDYFFCERCYVICINRNKVFEDDNVICAEFSLADAWGHQVFEDW